MLVIIFLGLIVKLGLDSGDCEVGTLKLNDSELEIGRSVYHF